MQTCKKVLCRERLRHISRPFSWVDPRLIRDGWLGDCSPTAWALYLFWVTAADANGLSYYSDKSVARHLGITLEVVRAGRSELVRCGVLAYDAPFVQVLSLDRHVKADRKTFRSESAVHIGDVLRSMAAKGGGL
jgi:hypothetical protein